jgi:dTDP-4-dehydrorhamnose 3,5-epimerase
VIVDLRPGSPTWRAWAGFELDARQRRLLYVPEGFAHGFITLEPDTEVFYEMSAEFVPEASRGFRFDDPAIGIDWPMRPACISDRDAALPLLARDATP